MLGLRGWFVFCWSCRCAGGALVAWEEFEEFEGWRCLDGFVLRNGRVLNVSRGCAPGGCEVLIGLVMIVVSFW